MERMKKIFERFKGDINIYRIVKFCLTGEKKLMIVKKENIVKRKIHDTYFLIDISDKYLDDKCHLYEINEIGNFIWDQIGVSSNSVSDIVNALIETISENVDDAEIYNDVKEFINVLVNENFLEVKNGGD